MQLPSWIVEHTHGGPDPLTVQAVPVLNSSGVLLLHYFNHNDREITG